MIALGREDGRSGVMGILAPPLSPSMQSGGAFFVRVRFASWGARLLKFFASDHEFGDQIARDEADRDRPIVARGAGATLHPSRMERRVGKIREVEDPKSSRRT